MIIIAFIITLSIILQNNTRNYILFKHYYEYDTKLFTTTSNLVFNTIQHILDSRVSMPVCVLAILNLLLLF